MCSEGPEKNGSVNTYLFIHLLFIFIYKPGETIQWAALFSHGTQVAMFSRKCRARISISKTGMGRDPKRKNIKQKITKTATLSKSVARKQAQKESYKNQKKKPSPAHPCHRPLPDLKTQMPVPTI